MSKRVLTSKNNPKSRDADTAKQLLEDEARRMAAVRLDLLRRHPFWGHMLMFVRLEPAPELPAFAATDCIRRIWFNPNWTRHLNVSQLTFVLTHELGHHLLASKGRSGGRNWHTWNCATDYAINRIVAQIGSSDGESYQSPNGTYPGIDDVEILLDARFSGMIAESIYEILRLEAPVRELGYVTVMLPTGDGVLELPVVRDHGGGIDVHLPVDLSDSERDELADRVVQSLQRWQQANERGDMPGDVVREIGVVGGSAVCWQTVLRRFVGETRTAEEYSYRRPNRRMLMHDLVVPGRIPSEPSGIVVAVDTSGSMSRALLTAVAGELVALAQECDDMTVILADAKVQREITPAELQKFLSRPKFLGGGGTDHRPVFEYLQGKRQPTALIAMTDLWSKFPAKPPPYPVLWVAPKRHGAHPFGQLVEFAPKS